MKCRKTRTCIKNNTTCVRDARQEAYNECVVVLTSGGSVSDMLLYTMGLRDSKELDTMVQQFLKEEDVETPEELGTYTYDDSPRKRI